MARAPGRVNLIGDHTDYCGGLALPVAVDLCTEVAFSPTGSPALDLRTDADRSPVTLPLSPPGDHAPGAVPQWGRLAAAVVAQVRPPAGGTVDVRSSVPVGAGLSSSAAFCVGLALALGADAAPPALASLCQRAEAAVGSHVGLLDPLAVTAARPGHALLVDFATLDLDHVPVPEEAALVVVHSGVTRTVGGSPYAARRAECEQAAAALGAPLGRAEEADLARLSGPLRQRARHVVTECRRVREAAAALRTGDLPAAGRCMAESHRSLATDFAATVPAVDDLVAHLLARPGVHGARMTGAGFGGCVVALAERGALDPGAWPGRCWEVRPSAGATREAWGPGRGR